MDGATGVGASAMQALMGDPSVLSGSVKTWKLSTVLDPRIRYYPVCVCACVCSHCSTDIARLYAENKVRKTLLQAWFLENTFLSIASKSQYANGTRLPQQHPVLLQ